MPLSLGKSDATREKNISREIASGKDPKQAVAIGYSEQRKARHIKAADMDIGKDKGGKKMPALAIEFGAPKPGEDMSAVDDKGGDDEAAIMQKAGDAAMEAFHAGDGEGFMRAIMAGMDARGGGDEDEGGADEEE